MEDTKETYVEKRDEFNSSIQEIMSKLLSENCDSLQKKGKLTKKYFACEDKVY